jgi:hypothetical protein
VNEENIGYTLRLMNVANGLPYLCRSFATVDVRKLVVCQVEAKNKHGFLMCFWCYFNTLGSPLDGGGSLDS